MREAVLVEHPGQVTAGYLHVAAGELGWQAEQLSAAIVDETHRAASGPYPAQLREHPHPLQHGQMRLAAEIDGLTAAA